MVRQAECVGRKVWDLGGTFEVLKCVGWDASVLYSDERHGGFLGVRGKGAKGRHPA